MRQFGNPLVNAMDMSHFYVITVISNPIRYQSRIALFEQFRQHIKDLGGNLIVVELAYGNRPFAITNPYKHFINQTYDPASLPQLHNNMPVQNSNPDLSENHNVYQLRKNPLRTSAIWANDHHERPKLKEYHIQYRTEDELWHKENMINLAINQLNFIDPKWEAVAWVDADVHFQRPDILLETKQQLEHYDFVQMFSQAMDLGPEGESFREYSGFIKAWIDSGRKPPQGSGYTVYYGGDGPTKYWHSGYCWAGRRRALEKVMLLDKAICGAADHHMAMALIGCSEKSIPGTMQGAYRDYIEAWQELASSSVRQNVGFVPGLVTHYWHGKKINRKYNDRWAILNKNQFNPYTDIMPDAQGIYRLASHYGKRSIDLRDDLREYFRARAEDSIDM